MWSLFCKNPWPIKLEDLRVRPAEEFKKKKYMFMHHWVEQGQMLGNIIALMFLGIDFAYLHTGGKCVSKVNKCLECVLEVLNYIFKQLSLICRKNNFTGFTYNSLLKVNQ